jgi:hypothetical protein
MRKLAVDAFERKVAAVEQYEPGLMSEAQRFFLLSQTDSLWKEHLQVCGRWPGEGGGAFGGLRGCMSSNQQQMCREATYHHRCPHTGT